MTSISAIVPRLTLATIRTTSLPIFTTAADAHESAWSEFAQDTPGAPLPQYLTSLFTKPVKPRCVVFGEQHHQPKVLAAQLQLIHTLANPPLNLRVKIVMEHFNLLQQGILNDFAHDGDAEKLQREYAKSSEGFRITQAGYLPLLQLARELDNVQSSIVPGFPPREWARIILREGIEGLKANADVQRSGALEGFDRWDDIKVSKEYDAYIRSSITGEKPVLRDEVKQGGLNAAQAFKDTVLAWTVDKHLETCPQADVSDESSEILVVITGSGHCEYDFGTTERIRNCHRDETVLVITKPDDGFAWTSASEDRTPTRGRSIGDAVIVYEAVDV